MDIASAKLKELLNICYKQDITVGKLNCVQRFHTETQIITKSTFKPVLKIITIASLLLYALHIYSDSVQSKRCLLGLPSPLRYSFRPPEDCDFCKNVQEVARLHDLSRDEFVTKYAYTGRPVIVEDATQNWTALIKFNYWYFHNVYNKAKHKQKVLSCQFLPYKTGFRDLYEALNMPASRVELQPGKEPWYFGWSNCQPEMTEEFRKHYGRPYFLPNTSDNHAVDWFFIGRTTEGAHMHVDNVRLASWQAQLTGSKRWLLVPPPECYFKCRRFEVIVETGNIIVLNTNKWYHQTFVEPGVISLTVGAEYD